VLVHVTRSGVAACQARITRRAWLGGWSGSRRGGCRRSSERGAAAWRCRRRRGARGRSVAPSAASGAAPPSPVVPAGSNTACRRCRIRRGPRLTRAASACSVVVSRRRSAGGRRASESSGVFDHAHHNRCMCADRPAPQTEHARTYLHELQRHRVLQRLLNDESRGLPTKGR
jgi:hypothetical protein